MSLKFNRGDWVLIGNGNKAHRLVQGYNGLVPRCHTKNYHPGTGTFHGSTFEQDQMRDGSLSTKCRRCK